MRMTLYTEVVAGCFESTPARHVSKPGASPCVRAQYDAARDTNETKNLWAGCDVLDADASNSLFVRDRLRKRSRNERANNGHCSGIIRTQANYVVGVGAKLRVQTGSTPFNQMVESAFVAWSMTVGLPKKIRTMCRAKTGDGEAFGMLIDNPLVQSQVKLDLRLIECDQVASPLLFTNEEGYVDGIRFDEYGNVKSYDVLKRHPGANWYQAAPQEYNTVNARFMCHWFGGDERPGQHRGIPELTPSLNLFGTGRRYREAVVAAAETAADFSVIVQMGLPQEGPDEYAAFSTLPIDKRTMTVSPAGATVQQLKAEQPTTTHESFVRSMVCEEARPLNMPYNIAACDSSGYSYSGGQLDHQTYFVSVDVERQECELLVLDKIFSLWFEEATKAYGWVGDGSAPKHAWDWPGRPQNDPEKTANSRKTRLSCGDISPSECAAEDGVDFDDRVTALARDYGVTEQQIREKMFDSNFQKSGGAPSQSPTSTPATTVDTPAAPANGKANGHFVNRITERLS
jgi:capsid protein